MEVAVVVLGVLLIIVTLAFLRNIRITNLFFPEEVASGVFSYKIHNDMEIVILREKDWWLTTKNIPQENILSTGELPEDGLVFISYSKTMTREQYRRNQLQRIIDSNCTCDSCLSRKSLLTEQLK